MPVIERPCQEAWAALYILLYLRITEIGYRIIRLAHCLHNFFIS